MNLTEVNLQLALEEALTAAAPDGGSWLAGKETFWQALPQGSIGQALEEALTAAAPDGGSWLAGKETFVNYIGGRKRPWRFRDEQFSPRQLRERTGENHPPSNMKGRSR